VHHREDSLACHGGPGASPAGFAAGLHPSPPALSSPQVRSSTDGVLHRAIAGDVGTTWIPAFGKAHSPVEVWSIVAFLRRLPALTPEQRSELCRAGRTEGQPPAESGRNVYA